MRDEQEIRDDADKSRMFVAPEHLEGYIGVETGQKLIDLYPNGLIVKFDDKGEVIEIVPYTS